MEIALTCHSSPSFKNNYSWLANTFIALFKDTPLILVVGLLELIGMIDMAKANPYWLGFAIEGYVFAGAVYWVFCFSMSRYSLSLEKKYKTDR